MINYLQRVNLLLALLMPALAIVAQKPLDLISETEAGRIEKTLSADDMQGRGIAGIGIEKAASFIASEFAKAGLDRLPNNDGYLQPFSIVKPKFISAAAIVNGTTLEQNKVIVVTTKPLLEVSEKSGFEVVTIKEGAEFFSEAYAHISSGQNRLVLVDTSFTASFSRLTYFKRQLIDRKYSTLFLLGNFSPQQYQIIAKHDFSKVLLKNVVGMIPGRSRKEEFVVFSGHYDHLGTTGKPEKGDSIFNGANDDAAGTTAVILLANYFRKLNNNERTLLFVAFTAEESGGFGSTYFSHQFDPAKVAAMFNIEMIGTESKWGSNTAYITGYDQSDLGSILQKNLKGTGFSFHPDPYPEQQLFYRSDNATLARLGVPAHTISTSKMDNEKFYHTVEDEFETLDIGNMTQIIRAIALSTESIVAGKDTPSRISSK